jgi:hypothetical protein
MTGPASTADRERDNQERREWWREQAARLSAELGFEIHWCPLGFEVPRRDGGIKHVQTADDVRTILGGSW